MKGLVVLIVLVGVGIWAAYYFGGFSTLDPAQQMAEMEQKVKPGMTWDQVADIREPKRYYVYDYSADNPERKVDFDRAGIANAVASNGHPDGFKFRYEFSSAAAFEVMFDEKGIVSSAGKGRTAADLLTLPGGQSQ